MPQQPTPQVENAFTKGLLTEFTGLNFPENAATDTDNCVYTLVGNVTRREGIDYEANFALNTINRASLAINTYKWNNVGGDGLTQLVVQQTGGMLYFYSASAATILQPLSTKKLVSTVDVSQFVAAGGVFDTTIECQFSDGNGYLFVYHSTCDPFYCTYAAGTITANLITIQIRDFAGIPEPGVADNLRTTTLTPEHNYNLLNQGWGAGAPWSAVSTTSATFGGTTGFTILSGLSGISVNQPVNVTSTGTQAGNIVLTGTVTSYNSGSGALAVNITSVVNHSSPHVGSYNSWTIVPANTTYIDTWFSIIHNYPSNADQWWNFKNSSDVFDPATTQANVSVGSGPAPKGHTVLNAFNQTRTAASSVLSLTDVTTTVRPRTGCWFQGRVWYTGVDSSSPAAGDAPYSTWTENIYFSQIVQNTSDFGQCYQTNDPTSQDLFDLLTSDGGVMTIQGCGSIYKLFPMQNALLIFAANGVWYVTGSSGIGFAANDYTVVKLSAVRSISSTSFVDVNGLPMFWNEEGIYSVESAKQGTSLLNSPLHVNPLEVIPVTVGTILTFYNSIPLQSKKYARGSYDPIEYTLQWLYKETDETSVTNRYDFDRILNYNSYNKAFYPFSLPAVTGKPHVHGIEYVAGPGGSTSPDPVFKYLTASSDGAGSYNFTFSEENNNTFNDFVSFDGIGFNFTSYFVTGYRLTGQAQRRIQIPYIYMFSRGVTEGTSFYLQSIWDYAISGNSGRWSTRQQVNSFDPNYSVIPRRMRLRGQGLALQIKVTSVDGQLFDIMGWSTFTSTNTGV